MKAVVLYEHGGMDKLVYEENFPDPECGPNDVVLRVKASSLNYHDLFTRNGMPGIKLNLPIICGLDVAGEIVEVGSDGVLVDTRNRVEGGLVGETIHGGLAEYCRAPTHQLVTIPEGVSFAEAASLPVAYGTAHRMMVTRGQVNADDTVMILGASGGVGTGAVLLAKILGAEVIALSSSEAKLKALRELGADKVLNYAETDFVKEIWKLYDKLGQLHALSAPRSTPTDLRRDRRLRSKNGLALCLELRIRHSRIEQLGAGGPRQPPRLHRRRKDEGSHRRHISAGRGNRGPAAHRGP